MPMSSNQFAFLRFDYLTTEFNCGFIKAQKHFGLPLLAPKDEHCISKILNNFKYMHKSPLKKGLIFQIVIIKYEMSSLQQ